MKSKYIMTGFALVMLAYQAWRVFDYMGSSLQGVSDTVRFIVSVAFLAFSEVGLIIWLHVGKPNATTDIQEATATTMIWVNFFGSMLVGLADMLKHNTMYVVDLAFMDPVLFIAPWALVVLNVGGYLIYHQADSEAQTGRAERRLLHEEAKTEIEARRAAIRQLQQNRQAIADELAPHYYQDIADRITGRTLTRFKRKAGAARRKAAAEAVKDEPIPELDEIAEIERQAVTAKNGKGRKGR